jgi:NAD(P)-dependent dehydrogenase (short-subunit alcohol dehydrogenase family)
VVTGSASGIGEATRALLVERGDRVIRVDVRDADVVADLSTVGGRAAAVQAACDLAGGRIDGVIACAGHSADTGTAEQMVRVNYFGAVAVLEELQPRLARSAAPRAAVIASVAFLYESDDALTEACLAGDEESAVARAGDDGGVVYSSTKRAIALWVRRSAPGADWAGAGIALNAVAPGIVRTPMSRRVLDDPERYDEVTRRLQQPLRPVGEPIHIASLLAWLTGAENGMVTGQVVLADGGFEALKRGLDLPRVGTPGPVA